MIPNMLDGIKVIEKSSVFNMSLNSFIIGIIIFFIIFLLTIIFAPEEKTIAFIINSSMIWLSVYLLISIIMTKNATKPNFFIDEKISSIKCTIEDETLLNPELYENYSISNCEIISGEKQYTLTVKKEN